MSDHLMRMSSHAVIGPACREHFVPLRRLPAAFPGCVLAGVSSLAPPYRIVRERADFTLVLATLAGRGRIAAGGPQPDLVVEAGDVLVTAADTAHDYAIAGPVWDIAWLHLKPAWPGPARLLRGREEAPHLAAALRGLAAGLDDAPLTAAWSAVAVRLLERLASEAPVQRLRHLWRAVGEQLHRPWPVAELARRAGLSPAQLHRVCLAEHGCAPGRLLARLRLDRARVMLDGGDATLDAIAARVGYADGFALSKAFRRRFGASPARLRPSPAGSPRRIPR